MSDTNGYLCQRVIGRDEHSFVARTCLQRPSDGYYAVGYVERIPFKGEENKQVMETVTPLEDLNFTTEDAEIWEWWPTLGEAVEKSVVTFAPFEKWSVNAPNQ